MRGVAIMKGFWVRLKFLLVEGIQYRFYRTFNISHDNYNPKKQKQ